jgi:hypothetical protein
VASRPLRLRQRSALFAAGGTVIAVFMGGCGNGHSTGASRATSTSSSVPATTTNDTTASVTTGGQIVTNNRGTTAAGATTTTLHRPANSTSTPTVSTVAPAVCLNRTDPKCGPFYWAPQPPPNQPLTESITAVPAAPKVGEDVTFTVVFADADAGQPSSYCDNASQDFGDGSPTQRRVCDDASTCPWTGAHSPPAPRGSRWTATYHHVFQRTGRFVATFTGTSSTPGSQPHCVDVGSGRAGDPYASGGGATIGVTVTS